MKEWEIGDEFIIINPIKDGLTDTSKTNGIFKISKLTPDESDNGYYDPKMYDKRVWFRYDTDIRHCYASKTNIKRATKLHKVLK